MKKIAFAFAAILPISAVAEEGVATAPSCFEKQIAAQSPVADCIQQVQAACLTIQSDLPELQVSCFLDQKDAWGVEIKGKLQELQSILEDQKYQIVEISARYDAMVNLLECDRLHEMNLVMQSDANSINIQNARCQSTAAGLTYAKLYLQSRSLTK